MHSTTGVYALFILSVVGAILWLWSMYVYIPINYPTRMRSLGTGWTDGVGHLGAWGASSSAERSSPRPRRWAGSG